MQHEHNNGLVPCGAFVLYYGNQGLFFLIIKMTRRDDFFAYEFHHFRWIIGELHRSDKPSKVPLEANKETINRIWLELQRLEVGSVMSECWRGYCFRCE